MANSLISPGIETKIIDLNSYLNAVPGTVGFVPIITEKGKDNELVRVTGNAEFIEQFGEPDIRIFGKYYGCGPYIATQHLSVSDDLFVVRVLPDDATYSHAYIYFSEVDDYPYSYMFAKRFEKQICDPNETYITPLYKVADGTGQVETDHRGEAIAAGKAYDADKQPINLPDMVPAVVYTSDTAYAEPTEYVDLYDIEVNPDAEPPVDKRPEAIKAGKAYNIDFVLLDTDADVDLAFFTTDAAYAAEGAIPSHAIEKTYTRVGILETKGSKYDYNVGYDKIHGEWYFGNHTSISAFSVVADMEYAVQSDVPCYQQAYNGAATAYVINSEYKNIAFKRRVGFDSNGILVLDDEERISLTTRVELAKISEDESNPGPVQAEIDVKAPVWDVDPEPWYVIDHAKVEDAIKDYDAYDENGFLTNNPDAATYCGNFQYADLEDQPDPNNPSVTIKVPKKETEIALRKPAVSKFVDKVGHLRFVMNRNANRFEENAMVAIQNLAAWDKNGYPALSVQDVYVTSMEEFAVKAKTPKMNNTQKLDNLFYTLDTVTLAAINAQEGDPIYSKNGRLPHDAILGYVRAVGRGSYYNDYAIKITSDANPQNFGTYKFQVFELQDGVEVIAESFNVSFDPTALDGEGESLYFVDVINKFSTRVVVEANESAVDLFRASIKEFYQNDPTIENTAEKETFEADGYDIPLVGYYPSVVPTFVSDETADDYEYIRYANFDTAVAEVKAMLESTAETEAEKAAAKNYAVGLKGRLIWEAYYAKAWAEKYTYDASKAYNEALALDDSDDTKNGKIALAIEMMNKAEEMTATANEIYSWATSSNLMNMEDSDPITAGGQPYYLDNGSLGSLINSKGLVNSTIADQILCWAYTGMLKNPVVQRMIDQDGNLKFKQKYTDNVYDSDWIYFSIVYDPGYKPDVKQAALELVDIYRDDCFLVSDCGDNADYEETLKYVGAVKGAASVRAWNTFRAARFDPYSRIYDKYIGKDIWVSPVFHMAQLFPKNDSQYGMQYASAGFNRAVISSIKELRYSPNKAQRDQLYMAQVNPIVYFPEGMTVWGNLTTQKKASPLSDINNVRVVLYIKRALEQYLRNFIFEFNESITWERMSHECSAFLSQCQSSNMINGYSIDVGATEYELKTKTAHVNVTLTLKRTLEKIELNLYVQ